MNWILSFSLTFSSFLLFWFSDRKSYTPRMNTRPKIAIIHDAFLYRGGGERLVTLMAKSLDADLVSGFFSEGSFDPRELGFTGRIIPLGKPVFRKWIRHMILKWRFFWSARILREYDIVIFSGDCLGALRHVRTDAQVYYYCHTPPRYLYDFRAKYLSSFPSFLRPFFRAVFSYFARKYEQNLRKFDTIFTNSRNVEKRLRDFTRMNSEIIYPPIDTSFFVPSENPQISSGKIYPPTPLSRGASGHILSERETNQPSSILPSNYFFSWARLSPPKRIGIIIDTFLSLPEHNLIFSYGKNDPLKGEILAKVAWVKNITAIEAPDDATLLSLIQQATATIYIPVDEDFGMSPVESMACGVPVIGSKEGWLLETVIDGKTGKLIEIPNHDVWVTNLKNTIQNTPPEEWQAMKEDCRVRAADFSLEKFREKLQYYR